jgi:hypothetical protein
MAGLDRLSILCRQSHTIVREAGGQTFSRCHPDGVKYAWHLHYLVHGWIPAQCIVTQFGYEEFLQLCTERNIKEGKNLWP